MKRQEMEKSMKKATQMKRNKKGKEEVLLPQKQEEIKYYLRESVDGR